MEQALLGKIDTALAEIRPMADKSFEPAVSIERQLAWCRAFLLGSAGDDRPGPFSMGLIAVREFDMYGDRPELAALINEIQRSMQATLSRR